MTQGTVKWFSGAKGFGFITPQHGGPDLFLHHSQIQDYDFKGLAEGLLVEFEIGEGRQGPHAALVRIV